MKLGVVLQFGDQDEIAFRAALSKGGMARVQEAVEGIDALKAEATLRTDLTMILLEIESSMGVDSFNQLIREGVLAEYKNLAMNGFR
jgi:hypothetical protein